MSSEGTPISFRAVPFARQLAFLEANTNSVAAHYACLTSMINQEIIGAESLENISKSNMYSLAEFADVGTHAATRKMMTSFKVYIRKKSNNAFDRVHKIREAVLDVTEATLAQSQAFIPPNRSALAEADLCVDRSQQALETLSKRLTSTTDKYKVEKRRLERLDTNISAVARWADVLPSKLKELASASECASPKASHPIAAASNLRVHTHEVLMGDSGSTPLHATQTPAPVQSCDANVLNTKLTKKQMSAIRAESRKARKSDRVSDTDTVNTADSSQSCSTSSSPRLLTPRSSPRAARFSSGEEIQSSSFEAQNVGVAAEQRDDPLKSNSAKAYEHNAQQERHKLAQRVQHRHQEISQMQHDMLKCKQELLETIQARDAALTVVSQYFAEFELRRKSSLKEGMLSFCKIEREALQDKLRQLDEFQTNIEQYDPAQELQEFVSKEKDLDRSMRYSQALALLDWYNSQVAAGRIKTSMLTKDKQNKVSNFSRSAGASSENLRDQMDSSLGEPGQLSLSASRSLSECGDDDGDLADGLSVCTNTTITSDPTNAGSSRGGFLIGSHAEVGLSTAVEIGTPRSQEAEHIHELSNMKIMLHEAISKLLPSHDLEMDYGEADEDDDSGDTPYEQQISPAADEASEHRSDEGNDVDRGMTSEEGTEISSIDAKKVLAFITVPAPLAADGSATLAAFKVPDPVQWGVLLQSADQISTLLLALENQLTRRYGLLTNWQYKSCVVALLVILNHCVQQNDVETAVRVRIVARQYYRKPSKSCKSHQQPLHSGYSTRSPQESDRTYVQEDPLFMGHPVWRPQNSVPFWSEMLMVLLGQHLEQAFANKQVCNWELMSPQEVFQTVKRVHSVVTTQLTQVVVMMQTGGNQLETTRHTVLTLARQFELAEDKEQTLLQTMRSHYGARC